MAEDDASDDSRSISNDGEADVSDRDRQERLVNAFAELEGVFELIEADDGNAHSATAGSLAGEVAAVRKRLTFEPDAVDEAELRKLAQRIQTDLEIDLDPSDFGSD